MPTWFYRLLLRAYPAPFRSRYGSDLVEGFEFVRGQVGPGFVGRLRFFWSTTVDVLRSGFRERVSRRGYRMAGGGGVRLPSRGVGALLADLALDLRYAVRTLRATPGYLFGITLTLALGIGANTALFSAAWGVFGRPLPFEEGNELVHVESFRPGYVEGMPGTREMSLSVAELDDLKEIPGFEDVAEYHRMSFTMLGPEGPDLIRAAVVSSNYFDFLGMQPMLGRVFDPAEDHLGAHPVIVLSNRYWRDVFEADPDVVGRTVRMNGADHEIVGVLPPLPQFPADNDIFLPISVCPTRSDAEFISNREGRLLLAYARLGDGVSMEEARGHLALATDEMHAGHDLYGEIPGGHDFEMTSVREELVARARPVVWPLVAISVLLLVVACANAAGLALSRATRRLDSLVVRSAMGAGQGRIARQLLTEAVLLAVLGGLAGLTIAVVGSDLLSTFAERFTTRAQEIRLDRTVLAFSVLASVLTGLTFGMAPVLVTRRLGANLGRRGSATAGRSNRVFQRALVGVQVMVAFAVVAGAGLLLRSFWNANSVAVGFETESVITAEFVGTLARYPDETSFRDMLDEVRIRLRDRTDFVAVARIPWAPIADPHFHRDGYYVGMGEGEWYAAVGDGRAVDPEYFEVLGLELVEGRYFTATDTLGAEPVAVVNRTFYERHMEGVVPVGGFARPCPPEERCGEPVRVVGIVEDARINGAEYEPSAELLIPLDQTDWFASVLLARVVGDPESALQTVVEAAHAIDPEVAVRNAGSLEHFRWESLAPRRFMATLLTAFGLVALGLALTGIFGVTALAASARTREIGIRRAFGASEREVERMVLREGLSVVVLGWVGGLALTLGTGSLLSGLLFDLQPWDPTTLAVTAALFFGASWIACVLPARRASRTEVARTLTTS